VDQPLGLPDFFSGDERPGTAAAAAADGTVRLWDVATGRERLALRCDGLAPMAIAFSPDGRTVVAGGVEPFVVLWDISDSATSW
jgi:WD40 repeat protein